MLYTCLRCRIQGENASKPVGRLCRAIGIVSKIDHQMDNAALAPKALTVRNWLTLLTSFVILTVAFAFGLFCWPAIYRPLVKTFGWNFASANLGGSLVLFMIGI